MYVAFTFCTPTFIYFRVRKSPPRPFAFRASCCFCAAPRRALYLAGRSSIRPLLSRNVSNVSGMFFTFSVTTAKDITYNEFFSLFLSKQKERTKQERHQLQKRRIALS